MAVLIALVVALACDDAASPGIPTPDPQPAPGPPVRVLLLTATAGFRHDSIGAARAALTSLGTSTGEFVVSHTEDVTAVTAAAVLGFVNGGGGFIGVHSATDTLYTWPEYGNLIGACFREHPWTQAATVTVEDRTHPSTASLGGTFVTGDYPLAWTHSMGQGRVYYNALGHFAATWADVRFLTQIRAAIRWAAGRS